MADTRAWRWGIAFIRLLILSALIFDLIAKAALAGTISVEWDKNWDDFINNWSPEYRVFWGRESRGNASDNDDSAYPNKEYTGSPEPVYVLQTEDCDPQTDPFPPRYYMAAKSVRYRGTSESPFSAEGSGFPRPEIHAVSRLQATQGDAIQIDIQGNNYIPSSDVTLVKDEREVFGLQGWTDPLDCQTLQVEFEFGGNKDGSRNAEPGLHTIVTKQWDGGCYPEDPEASCNIFGEHAQTFEILFLPWLADLDNSGTVDQADVQWMQPLFGYTAEEAQADGLLNDWNIANLDGNQIIDGGDLAFLMAYYNQQVNQTTAASSAVTSSVLAAGAAWTGDQTGDGSVDAADMAVLLRYRRWGLKKSATHGPGRSSGRRITQTTAGGESQPAEVQTATDTAAKEQFLQSVSGLVRHAKNNPIVRSSSPQRRWQGDIDRDGKVSQRDLQLAREFLGKSRNSTFKNQRGSYVIEDYILFEAADIDRSGIVDEEDVRQIERLIDSPRIKQVEPLQALITRDWVDPGSSIEMPLPLALRRLIDRLHAIERGDSYKYALDLNMDLQVNGEDVALLLWEETPPEIKKSYQLTTLPGLPADADRYLTSAVTDVQRSKQ